MTDLSLPALREAVTTMGTCRCYGVEGCDACADNMYAILNALPALLDEVEALTGRTCRRCDKWDECGEDGQGECQFFGVHTREDFTCGAWAAKEGA